MRIVQASGVDCSSVALDMTNFATFIGTANGKAPVARRGKAKQKRSDLRLAGLGLVVTRDGGIPLTWHAPSKYRPDVTQFPAMIDQLLRQYQAVCAAAGRPGRRRGHDGGLRRRAELRGQLRPPGRSLPACATSGSVPASDCPDLTALPASARTIVDRERFGGLTACDTRREVYEAERRAIPHPLPGTARLPGSRVRRHHAGQGRQETRRAGRHPGPRQDPPRPGQGRSRDRVNHPQTLGPPVNTWQLTGDRPPDLRLAPGKPTPPPAPPWKRKSSASTC